MMRQSHLLCAVLSGVIGCAPGTEPTTPRPAAVPSVFPPPEQLVDDRSASSLDASTSPEAPDAVAPAPSEPKPQGLRIDFVSGTLMYPRTMSADEAIALRTSHPVTADALAKAIEIVGARSKEDLVAWRTEPFPFEVEAVPPDQDTPAGLAWLIVPKARYAVGAWYRMRIPPSLQGSAPSPLGAEVLAYLRGPEPLSVTSVACGWPACTPEDSWTVSFNAEIAAASLPGCFTTRPALDLGKPEVVGWSVVLHPRAARIGTEYRLTVNDRCKNDAGDRLRSPYETTLRIESPRARLAMVQGTGYMTPPKAGAAPVVTVSAGYTGRLTVGTARIDKRTLPSFLAANLETWGGFSFKAATVEHTSTITPAGADGGSVAVPVPLGPALGGDRGLVFLRVDAERKGDEDEPPSRQALVQVTELGLSVKSGPEDTLVWVTSLVDQRPLAGVEIQALDPKGKMLWTRTTDERGMAVGPGRKDTNEEGEARIIMASLASDLAFIDLAEYANRSEPYEFGLPNAWDARPDALRGIVFTERGVYRAGETVHVKGYVRVDRGRRLEKVPAQTISVTITNPLGDRALQRDVDLGAVGDFELDVPLAEAAALGSWRVEAEVTSGANGTVAGGFRVEAYRPNTFEVKVADLARQGDHLTARASGRYYYGAPMAGASARWWVHREDADFSPKGYEDYSFEVPTWSDDRWEPRGASVEAVASGDATLDGEGAVAIDADFSSILKALSNGPETLALEVEVTDVDQQVVTGRGSLRIESADHYLGVRPSTTFAGVGEAVQVDTVAVTPGGEPVAKAAFELRWIERTWVTKQVVAAGTGLTWQSEPREEVLERRSLVTALEPVRASFTPRASGLYWVEVAGRDAKGREMTAREAVWVWGDGASWAEDDQGHIEVIAAQETWKVGDTARFVVQSPFPSAEALITVETSGIVWRDVRRVSGTAPLIEIPVSDAMQPNAYVSVMLVGPRSAGGKPVESEVRLGYARMNVDTSDRRLGVEVQAERASYAPGERVRATIKLSDSQGHPASGQVAFMAVDEGVLSLTGYRTPDPHQAFYAERALAIVTSEGQRQLWSKLTADAGMKSDWGGGGEGGEATNYRAAFATTAAFIPDVAVGADGQAEVSFDLPDNLTTFRLMAVAASEEGRFGQGESKLEVRKPLLVRPGLPRFLSVGDRFDARAVVQALDPESAGPVDVTISVSGPVAIDGTDHLRIEAGDRATPVAFAVRATEPGTATFAFAVRSAGGASAAHDGVEVRIPVLWPAAKRSAYTSAVVPTDREDVATTLQIPDWVRDDIGGVDVTLTASRLGELLPGLDYLLEYPYGCVEQTTGGTLPLLALSDLQSGFSLPGISHQDVMVRAQAGLDRLRGMQTWSGGLGYWPGDTTPHPWGSVYAGMALVRASKMPGLTVPPAVLERLTSYLRDILRDQAATAREEWHSEIEVVKPFAAYVLALAGTPEPAFHATLFQKRAELPDFGKLLLALAITEAHGDKVMATTLVDEVLETLRIDGDSARLERDQDHHYYYSTMDSDVRSMALLAMALQAVRPDDERLAKVQKGLLDERNHGRWMSTQENAFALLALARTFVATEKPNARFHARVEVDGQVWLDEAMSGSDATPKTLHLPMYVARKANGKKLVIARVGDEAPLYFSMRFDYAPKEVPKRMISRGFKLERRYTIASGARVGQPADTLDAGDLVRVDLTVETPEARRYVAVDDPLPAGLEPVTLDFATTRASLSALMPEEREWRMTVFNHNEQRDDRISLFADVMEPGKHSYSYLARATTRGAFLAPSAHVHEMYHPDVSGQSSANEMTVK